MGLIDEEWVWSLRLHGTLCIRGPRLINCCFDFTVAPGVASKMSIGNGNKRLSKQLEDGEHAGIQEFLCSPKATTPNRPTLYENERGGLDDKH
ncbi:hypothetical protein CLAIMM_10530 [Cladophialophora immunda]|nr:hypothetical protein CLAIMM_10530 [Cladophialophora immunda]